MIIIIIICKIALIKRVCKCKKKISSNNNNNNVMLQAKWGLHSLRLLVLGESTLLLFLYFTS